MRGAVEDLDTPVELARSLPGVYQEDEFLGRFLEAFDGGLAPVLATLDNLQCYVDPRLAPGDFLEWLGEWVGVVRDDSWDDDQLRDLVSSAVRLHRLRGTVAGISEEVRLAVGPGAVRVEVEESGGARWSVSPAAALPGEPAPALTVRIFVRDTGAVSVRRLDALLSMAKPAHVPHHLEVLAVGDTP